MISQEVLTIRRVRMENFRRLTKYAQQAVIFSGTLMSLLAVLQIPEGNWFLVIATMLSGFGFCFFSRWVAAAGTAISDNHDILEDVHHTLRKQQDTSEHAEG